MRKVISVVILLSAWQALIYFTRSPLLVSADRIILAVFKMALSGELWQHASISLSRVAIGFSIASLFGLVMGVLTYQYKSIDYIVTPIIDTVRPVAALALFPLIILLFGIGEQSKYFVIFWQAYPACLLVTVQALKQVDRSVLEAASLDGASKTQSTLYVTIPIALSTILNGFRVGLTSGWVAMIAAEMIGSQSGLGYSILIYSNSFNFPEVYATILTIAMLGVVMNSVMVYLQSLVTIQE